MMIKLFQLYYSTIHFQNSNYCAIIVDTVCNLAQIFWNVDNHNMIDSNCDVIKFDDD